MLLAFLPAIGGQWLVVSLVIITRTRCALHNTHALTIRRTLTHALFITFIHTHALFITRTLSSSSAFARMRVRTL